MRSHFKFIPVGHWYQIPINERSRRNMPAEFGVVELRLLAAGVDKNGETFGVRNLII